MSRRCTTAASNYLVVESTLVTNEPITMAGWIKMDTVPDATNTFNPIFGVYNGTSGAGFWRIGAAFSSPNVVARCQKQAPVGTDQADGTTNMVANTWYHIAGTYSGDANRVAYLNGVQEATNTTNLADATITRAGVGARLNVTPSQFSDARFAEIAIWATVLSASEIRSLAGGVSPLRVGNGTLRGYWPLYGIASPETDFSGGVNNLTLVNSPTQTDPPPVQSLMPGAVGWRGNFTTAAAGVLIDNIIASSIGVTITGVAAETMENLIAFAVAETFTGTVVKGNLTLQNRIATAISDTLTGDVVLGNAVVTNRIASAIADTLTGNVGAGDIFVNNQIALSLAETVTGNIIKGAIALTENVSSIGATETGNILFGSAVIADRIAFAKGDTRTRGVLIDGVQVQAGGRIGSGMSMWRRCRMGR